MADEVRASAQMISISADCESNQGIECRMHRWQPAGDLYRRLIR